MCEPSPGMPVGKLPDYAASTDVLSPRVRMQCERPLLSIIDFRACQDRLGVVQRYLRVWMF